MPVAPKPSFIGTRQHLCEDPDLGSLAQNAVGDKQQEVADALKDMGNTLFVNDEYEKAIWCYTLAATSYAPKPVYTCNLAAAYLRLNLYNEAEAVATQCLMYDPKSIKARYRRVVARKSLGRINAAIQDLRVIVSNDSSSKDAVQMLKELDYNRDSQWDLTDEFPGFHTKPKDLQTRASTSASNRGGDDHVGNGEPCFNYNHGGCWNGEKCEYSHAVDKSSVRDTRGKNVCFAYLNNACQWADHNITCPYSHHIDELSTEVRSIANRLPFQKGEDDENDEGIVEFGFGGVIPPPFFGCLPGFAHFGPVLAGEGIGDGFVWDELGDQEFIGEQDEENNNIFHEPGPGGNIIRRHMCAGGCSVCRGVIDDVRHSLLTVIVTLQQKFGSIEDERKSDLDKLHPKAPIVQVYTVESGLAVLDRAGPILIYVSDAGIAIPAAQPLVKKIKERVEKGDRVIFGTQFSSFMKMGSIAPFFRNGFGLPWVSGSYCHGTFFKNAEHPVIKASGRHMPGRYSTKALRLGGVKPGSVVYF